MEEILKAIYNQFKNKETCYGEPQAFIDTSNDRSVEIVKEMEGLEDSKYYYSCRVHCSEEEFENDCFHSTCGVIDTYCTDGLSENELISILEIALKCSESV